MPKIQTSGDTRRDEALTLFGHILRGEVQEAEGLLTVASVTDLAYFEGKANELLSAIRIQISDRDL